MPGDFVDTGDGDRQNRRPSVAVVEWFVPRQLVPEH